MFVFQIINGGKQLIKSTVSVGAKSVSFLYNQTAFLPQGPRAAFVTLSAGYGAYKASGFVLNRFTSINEEKKHNICKAISGVSFVGAIMAHTNASPLQYAKGVPYFFLNLPSFYKTPLVMFAGYKAGKWLSGLKQTNDLLKKYNFDKVIGEENLDEKFGITGATIAGLTLGSLKPMLGGVLGLGYMAGSSVVDATISAVKTAEFAFLAKNILISSSTYLAASKIAEYNGIKKDDSKKIGSAAATIASLGFNWYWIKTLTFQKIIGSTFAYTSKAAKLHGDFISSALYGKNIISIFGSLSMQYVIPWGYMHGFSIDLDVIPFAGGLIGSIAGPIVVFEGTANKEAEAQILLNVGHKAKLASKYVQDNIDEIVDFIKKDATNDNFASLYRSVIESYNKTKKLSPQGQKIVKFNEMMTVAKLGESYAANGGLDLNSRKALNKCSAKIDTDEKYASTIEVLDKISTVLPFAALTAILTPGLGVSTVALAASTACYVAYKAYDDSLKFKLKDEVREFKNNEAIHFSEVAKNYKKAFGIA